MPFIEEKDLVALHEQVEKSNQELQKIENNFKKEKKKIDAFISQRNVFIGVSAVSLILLLGGIITYLVNPTVFINESVLAGSGLELFESVEIDSLDEKIQEYEVKLQEYKEENEELLASNSLKDEESNSSIQNEMVYAVQVGAFEERMVSVYSKSFVNLKEFQEEEFYKYALGNFDNLKEAQRFRKELLKMGFKDAFIASYKDGKRLKIEEVM